MVILRDGMQPEINVHPVSSIIAATIRNWIESSVFDGMDIKKKNQTILAKIGPRIGGCEGQDVEGTKLPSTAISTDQLGLLDYSSATN